MIAYALPSDDDVRQGVRATRLAARIGDIAKHPERRQREKAVALARRDTRWDDHFGLLMFPEEAARIRQSRTPGNQKTCTMCGDFCARKEASSSSRMTSGVTRSAKVCGKHDNNWVWGEMIIVIFPGKLSQSAEENGESPGIAGVRYVAALLQFIPLAFLSGKRQLLKKKWRAVFSQ